MCIISLIGVNKKLEVFTAYYYKLTRINFKALCPLLVTAKIISIEDSHTVQDTVESSKAASLVLEKIHASLQGDTSATFDAFLCVLESSNDLFSTELSEHMRRDLRRDLLRRTAGKA